MTLLKRNGNIVGNYDREKNLFYKEVKKSKHLFRKLNAFAIDEEHFRKVLFENNSRIVIFDFEGKDFYSIRAEEFKKYSTYLSMGQGLQMFCPIVNFDVSKTLDDKINI